MGHFHYEYADKGEFDLIGSEDDFSQNTLALSMRNADGVYVFYEEVPCLSLIHI